MNDAKVLAKLDKWLLPMTKSTKVFAFKVGDLVEAGQRLCLVEKVSKHKKQSQRKVLVRWVGEDTSYWISCDILLKLIYWGDNEERRNDKVDSG
jgi:hypothetical protein